MKLRNGLFKTAGSFNIRMHQEGERNCFVPCHHSPIVSACFSSAEEFHDCKENINGVLKKYSRQMMPYLIPLPKPLARFESFIHLYGLV